MIVADKSEYSLPILAGLLSLYALSQNLYFVNAFGFIVSLVGLVASASFFWRRKLFYPLIQFWIYSQFPALIRTVSKRQEGVEFIQIQHVVNAGQGFTFRFLEFELGTAIGDFVLSLNIVPFVFLILYKITLSSDLLGKTVTILNFKKENKLGNVFPMSGVIKQSINLEKEKYWFHVTLSQPILIEGRTISNVLLKSKDGEIFKSGKKKYLSYLLLVENEVDLERESVSKRKFPFIDWVQVVVKK